MKTVLARSLTFALATAGLVALGAAAAAQTPSAPKSTAPAPAASPPVDLAGVQKQIDAFDPKAVAAAKNYFSQPYAKGPFVGLTDNVYQQVLEIITKQHPELSEDQMLKIEPIVGDPLKRRLDLLVQMNILNALKTFSTDELVALDTFYSSPNGKAILTKMPKLSEQVPAIVQGILPGYLAEVKTKLKAEKVEVEF